jgi:two-component system phosphate regulon sensor histidine kinase PhoR
MMSRSSLILPAFALLALSALGGLLVGGAPLVVALVAGGGALALALIGWGDGDNSMRADAASDGDRPASSLFGHADFAAFADASPDMIVGIDGSRTAFANTAARRVLGDHIVGTDIRQAIRHPAAADHLAAAMPRDAVDLPGLGRPGERWQLRTVMLGDGSRIAIMSDVAAREAAEAMRADFVANASHELRTPLASIIGAAETLEDAGVAADDKARARFTGIIAREGRRMQRLVDDLLSVSRIAADRHRAPTDRIDLTATAAATIEEIRGGGDARAADVTLSVAGACPLVMGDAGQIGQLLHNLVGNAMKYGRAGTPVTVALNGDDTGVCLTIADQGDGIAAQHLPRLTERFYRVDDARSRALGGTGLGLAIVKHIVERHRARMDIASTPGEGTRVTVTFPPAV